MAEDAAQETFIRVFRHIEKAPSEDQALGWIFRIATNYCLNELRNRKHRPLAVGDAPEVSTPDARSLHNILEDRDLVRKLIVRFPAKQRDVAWLHHIDGLGQEEVAQILGISRRSVGTYLKTFSKDARKYLDRTAL